MPTALKGVSHRRILLMPIRRNGMPFAFPAIRRYSPTRTHVTRSVTLFPRFLCSRTLSLLLFFSFPSRWKLKNRTSHYCSLLLEVSHKFAVVPSHLFVRRTNRDIRDDSFIIDPSISSHVCSRILLLDRESIYYTYLCYIMIPLQ